MDSTHQASYPGRSGTGGKAGNECAAAAAVTRDAGWQRAARRALLLSWLSLAYMAAEGAIAIIAAVIAGSVALLGFGLDSAIEGLASVIIVWRFTGTRTLSETAEARAQRAVAVTFFLLAPCSAYGAAATLAGRDHARTSRLGIGLPCGKASKPGTAKTAAAELAPAPERRAPAVRWRGYHGPFGKRSQSE